MGYRRFDDEQGRSWEVWEVHPALVERRLNADRRMTARADEDRREAGDVRFPIPRELEGGWLTFQCETERRRLSPIPAQWLALSDEDLTLLAKNARPYRVTPPGGVRRE
jgi:hypothetical protein